MMPLMSGALPSAKISAARRSNSATASTSRLESSVATSSRSCAPAAAAAAAAELRRLRRGGDRRRRPPRRGLLEVGDIDSTIAEVLCRAIRQRPLDQSKLPDGEIELVSQTLFDFPLRAAEQRLHHKEARRQLCPMPAQVLHDGVAVAGAAEYGLDDVVPELFPRQLRRRTGDLVEHVGQAILHAKFDVALDDSLNDTARILVFRKFHGTFGVNCLDDEVEHAWGQCQNHLFQD
mmetsp:Transcript_136219/g.344941  ORF Transcript_136219/g.344941 Transcript_136219/m.344941 type:complete len:234 (-) Transcript_136219:480-1181(-)